MLHVAILVCSDPECAERVEMVGTLAELETLSCDCGCGLLVAGWPAPLDAAGADPLPTPVPFPQRTSLPLAA